MLKEISQFKNLRVVFRVIIRFLKKDDSTLFYHPQMASIKAIQNFLNINFYQILTN